MINIIKILSNINISTSVNNNPIGAASGSYLENTFTYSSSIDSISNLAGKYSYDTGFTQNPLLIIMHGWTGDMNDITSAVLRRWAARGYFAVSIGMRGRNSADGSRDASARELHDVYDAITYLKANHSIISNKYCYLGYSGGGGNGIGLASKFPDLFNVIADFFGMSDYGYDAIDGWYFTNPAYSATIASSVGDTPANAPNEYRSRYHAESVPLNFVNGYFMMYHDPGDTLVDVINSDNLKTSFDANSKTNYELNRNALYSHGYPEDNANLIPPEDDIDAKYLSRSVWIIPTSGIIKVNGYIVTKRFSIWLGNGTASLDGTNRTATVEYNVNNNSYTVTPILETGATDVEVRITQGAKTATQTISTQTEIIVS